MEHPLYCKDWTKYLMYFMSHLYLIPVRLIWLSQFYNLGNRNLGDQIIFEGGLNPVMLVAKPLPFPGFPLPLLLLPDLSLGFSYHQGKELISARKASAFKAASVTWQSWNSPIGLSWAWVPVASFTSSVTVSQLLGLIVLRGVSSSKTRSLYRLCRIK